MEERKHIVILAAGDFPTHPVPLRALHEADFVVCCDSAYAEIRNSKFEIQNYAVVGDGDSLTEESKVQLGDRWLQVGEQDYNDLHKAICWATSKFNIHNSKFTILGATGKREDHTLGNISYLVTFAEEHPGIDIEMLTDHGRFSAFRGRRTFASFPRQQVSIFAVDPAVLFSGSGLEYPLDNMKVTRWWNATLNSALGDTFELWSDGWLIVFQTYEAK
jgi:thiamine pyrophosphokinase